MNLKDCRYSLVLIALLLGMVACAQEKVSDPVRLNQIGFYPTAQKIAVVITDVENEFYIATPDLKKKLFSGKLSEVRSSPYSSKKT
ncbi:MAG TPA: cellulase N-terminal Ig-like domain-containing protein, partial [Chryseolinea sp.]|nr:cellulase N-terminal Ig-like domain-containing protein [Chryseolinea sp.]